MNIRTACNCTPYTLKHVLTASGSVAWRDWRLRWPVDGFSLRTVGCCPTTSRVTDGGQRRFYAMLVEAVASSPATTDNEKNNNNNNRDDGRAQLYCPRTRVTAVRIPGGRRRALQARNRIFETFSAIRVLTRARRRFRNSVFTITTHVHRRAIIDFVPCRTSFISSTLACGRVRIHVPFRHLLSWWASSALCV